MTVLGRAVRGLGPIDVRTVGRDPMLRWLIFVPILLALAFRWMVPVVTERLMSRYGFDLVPYYTLIVSGIPLMAPNIVGVVVGFLLLDQKDDGTLAALQVTPLSLDGYLAYRISVPMAISVVLSIVAVPLVGLVEVHPLTVLLVALMASPLAPFYALLLAGFANNKVQGFAVAKMAGILSWPPVIAWFLPVVWQWVLGIVPQLWPMKVFWMLQAGERGVVPYVVVGLAWQAVLVALLLRRFQRITQR